MLYYLIYLVFIISVAMTAGGIILSSRLRSRHHGDIFPVLMYFQVFIFTFGFYGIWGQIVINSYLSAYISTDLLERIIDISRLLGLPFLVFAWLMLIRLACNLSGRTCSNWFVLGFLTLNFTAIVAIGYIIAQAGGIKPALLIRVYYITMNLIYSIASSLLIYFTGKKKPLISFADRKIIAGTLILIMLIQCLPVYFFDGEALIGLIFIVTFFAGNAFLPVYLSYGAKILPKQKEEPVKMISFEEFCAKYDVSPREKDIIREICNGLSNKEIAEKLFITLQTVKDHTHRIYIKTNVKSRSQLINLVKADPGKIS